MRLQFVSRCVCPPPLESTYRHEKIFLNSFRGSHRKKPVRTPGAVAKINICRIFRSLVRSVLRSPEKGALTRKWLKINSSGTIFVAIAGLSGKSPGTLTEETCYSNHFGNHLAGGGVG